jgi:DNA-binding transcriptional regulator YdaS (Cro superfamily)
MSALQSQLARLLVQGRRELLQYTETQTSVTPKIAVAIRHALDGEVDRAIEPHRELEQENISTNTRCLMLDILCIARRPDELRKAAERALKRIEAVE